MINSKSSEGDNFGEYDVSLRVGLQFPTCHNSHITVYCHNIPSCSYCVIEILPVKSIRKSARALKSKESEKIYIKVKKKKSPSNARARLKYSKLCHRLE